MADETKVDDIVRVAEGKLRALLASPTRELLERRALPRLVAGQRWFAGKGRAIDTATVVDDAVLDGRTDDEEFLLARVVVDLGRGDRQDYFVPIAVGALPEVGTLAHLGPDGATLRAGDAGHAPDFSLAVLDALGEGRSLATSRGGTIRFRPTSTFEGAGGADPGSVRRLSGEQSNTSIAIGDRLVLKLYRRLQTGLHPEVEVGRFLTEVAGFSHTPATFGSVEHVAADGTVTALMILQAFVANEGDAWSATLSGLNAALDRLASGDAVQAEAFARSLEAAATLGRRTGEMHVALATPTDDPAFAAEPMTGEDVGVAVADARAQAERAFAALAGRAGPAGPVADLVGRQAECLAALEAFAAEPVGALKTRIHGDYHLGQVLALADGDVSIVDFEGEPSRPVAERRAKASPLRDVAGMLRSFAYAADTAARDGAVRHPGAAGRVAEGASAWGRLVEERFLGAYEEGTRGTPIWVADSRTRDALLRLHLLGKALYEINYEADNRPDWIETPVRGVLAILGRGTV